MSLAKKLNLKDGMRLRVIGQPADVSLGDVSVTTAKGAQGVLLFAKTLADVDALGGPVVACARGDQLAWVAYPKAGKLGTDLNRDILHEHLAKSGADGVRLVAIDAVWSAMRFRPG